MALGPGAGWPLPARYSRGARGARARFSEPLTGELPDVATRGPKYLLKRMLTYAKKISKS